MALHHPTILVVLGNRPQFIKHAAVQRAWNEHVDDVNMVVIDTGQHYDYALAGIFQDELELAPPDHSLGIGSATRAEQIARMLPPLEHLIREHSPSSVVVYGDTNSTLGGSLAALSCDTPIAHIEAGLRSFDRAMPEETNRVLVDHMAELLFCPTDVAVTNLAREGVTAGIEVVGDVMTDIAMLLSDAADERWAQWESRGLVRGEFLLATIHRASNTEELALRDLVEALASLPVPVVFPVHPRTEAALTRYGLHVDLADAGNVMLLPPVGYVDAASLLRASRGLLSDSGGMQKEAYIHGVPCITLRDTSEWTETIDEGVNRLTHHDPEQIRTAVSELVSGTWPSRSLTDLPSHYGEGDAATRIVMALASHARAAGSLHRIG